MNDLPNLFIVGAPKCGTTSLALSLSENYDIYLPKVKEPAYFAKEKIEGLGNRKRLFFPYKNFKDYKSLYSNKSEYKYRIDASVDYFDEVSAPQRIKKLCDNAKIIILLRPHLQFLVSLHSEMIRSAGEDELDFVKALNFTRKINKFARSKKDLDYFNRMQFYKYTKTYIDVFGKKNVFVASLSSMNSDYFWDLLEIFLNIKIIRNVKNLNSSKKVIPNFYFKLQLLIRYLNFNKILSNDIKLKINNFVEKHFGRERKVDILLRDLPKSYLDAIERDDKLLQSIGINLNDQNIFKAKIF